MSTLRPLARAVLLGCIASLLSPWVRAQGHDQRTTLRAHPAGDVSLDLFVPVGWTSRVEPADGALVAVVLEPETGSGAAGVMHLRIDTNLPGSLKAALKARQGYLYFPSDDHTGEALAALVGQGVRPSLGVSLAACGPASYLEGWMEAAAYRECDLPPAADGSARRGEHVVGLLQGSLLTATCVGPSDGGQTLLRFRQVLAWAVLMGDGVHHAAEVEPRRLEGTTLHLGDGRCRLELPAGYSLASTSQPRVWTLRAPGGVQAMVTVERLAGLNLDRTVKVLSRGRKRNGYQRVACAATSVAGRAGVLCTSRRPIFGDVFQDHADVYFEEGGAVWSLAETRGGSQLATTVAGFLRCGDGEAPPAPR